MDKKIREMCIDEDKLYRGQFTPDEVPVHGPMIPNCIIAEDDFSPSTDLTGKTRNEGENEKQDEFNYLSKDQVKSDFTSQSTSMVEKITAEREIGRRISRIAGLMPSQTTINDLINNEKNK